MGREEGADVLAQGAQQGGAELLHAGVDWGESAVDEPPLGTCGGVEEIKALPAGQRDGAPPGGGERLRDGAKGLADWESVELERPGGGTVTVTGVPALHGPGERDEVEAITGQVVGFVLTGEGLPTVYVSGDNASLDLLKEIAARFGPVDTAVLLGARRVVPVHYDSWAHFTEGRDRLVAAFGAAGLADRLDLGTRG
ncbi:hypothetical protein CP974_22680 [Streptomyces fradiae ATCC 10745 = DSM 40063]|nr:hypothetical protein CP974_22680 [Streptomyces fradiae ATCC 10745 = DSM 40063]